MKKIIIILSLVCSSLASIGQLAWPPVTNVTKPWTRWWWEGSAVNNKDLSWNLLQYKNVGLGGVEITPIYGVSGHENEFIEFLSTRWMQSLQHTLRESKSLGLGVDLANGTGWPFGGPWVTDADASKSIVYKTYTLNESERLNVPVEFIADGWVRTANNKQASIDSILRPISKNKNLQALAIDQVQFPGKLPLKCVIAYNEEKKPVDLTQFVNAEGKLNWTAPRGKWTLYAIFESLHGKFVERAAPGGEGYAIDHFSAEAAKHYFAKFDEAFKGYDLSYLRGFFNDSYEVDDARGQASWTTTLFNEFQKRKGYNLKDHLPALFGKDEAQMNSRVIYDYRSVIDELILENFTQVWKNWAGSKGKIVRNQSHGSPANTLDLYSVVDIPETEGTDILRFKFATSAANVTGKKLVSSESATWLNEHFLSSWADVKKAIDLYFLGGVNHIFYHGTAYSPKEAPWPGWLFYAAVHFQPVNPQWKDFHVLNEYITRVQSFLQQGKPDNDVLLYYPIADRYSEPGNVLLQHFDGMERNFERTPFEEVANQMLKQGYSFDFFSDRQLQHFLNSNSSILSGGNLYKTILLPANQLMETRSLKKIIQLANNGATILVYKKLPNGVPGLSNLTSNSEEFKTLTSGIKFGSEGKVQKAKVGKGSIIIGEELEELLLAGNIQNSPLATKGLSVITRKKPGGKVYFINNRTESAFDDWITINDKAASVALFDAMTGKNGIANSRINNKGQLEILVSLQPFESILLQTFNSKKPGALFYYKKPVHKSIDISGNWTISFLEGGPTLPPNINTKELKTWTELGGEDARNFSGTAKYSIEFEKPPGNAASYLLDLGKVNETAEVFLNGKRLGSLIGPSYQIVTPGFMLKSTNKLEIIVANLMANRIAYMDRNNIPWKIFYNTNMPARKKENVKNGLFDASGWKPLSSGLLGPVTITALK